MPTEIDPHSSAAQATPAAPSKMAQAAAMGRQAPEPQIVRSVSALRQTVAALQQELASLPQAVADRTAESLEPLAQLRSEVTQVVRAYEQVTAVQRRAMDELAEETARKATEALREHVQSLQRTLAALEAPREALRAAESLPGRLEAVTERLSAAAALARPPSPRRRLAEMAAVGILAGGLALGGMLVSEQLRRDDAPAPTLTAEMQRDAAFGQRVWRNATPEERALLRAISARQPAQ